MEADTNEMLVLKIAGRRLNDEEARTLRDSLTGGVGGVTMNVYGAVDHAETYAYCRVAAGAPAHALAAVRARIDERYQGAKSAVLHRVSDLQGASHGQPAPWHYIVETDILPEAEQDLNAWYDQEHLPGLASVPGTVRAERFVCHDESPRYHACYDLMTQETFGCPEWLAVRASAWSDRVRPSFRNTRRTMFKKII